MTSSSSSTSTAVSPALGWTSYVLGFVAAVIMLQTLFFKFTGAELPIYIFTKLGAEPFGRYASGVAELIAGVLLLVPATRAYGAVLGAGIMGGAIMSHLTILGIVVMDDGGELFAMAIVTMLCSAAVAFIHRHELIATALRIVGRSKG